MGAVTTPVASGTLYASVADLRAVMSGTDSGSGTAAQLTDSQLELALYAAATAYRSMQAMSTTGRRPEANPPPILHDLTLDLAVLLGRQDLSQIQGYAERLADLSRLHQRDEASSRTCAQGTILLDPAVAPGIGI